MRLDALVKQRQKGEQVLADRRLRVAREVDETRQRVGALVIVERVSALQTVRERVHLASLCMHTRFATPARVS